MPVHVCGPVWPRGAKKYARCVTSSHAGIPQQTRNCHAAILYSYAKWTSARKHNSQNGTGLNICLALRCDYSPSRSSVQIITGGLPPGRSSLVHPRIRARPPPDSGLLTCRLTDRRPQVHRHCSTSSLCSGVKHHPKEVPYQQS